MKQLKDYLPFYTGRKILIDESKSLEKLEVSFFTISGFRWNDQFLRHEFQVKETGFWHDASTYYSGGTSTPIVLRRLQDMTEEERVECKSKGAVRFSAMEITYEKLEPEQFTKMLSKGFDLFGLMESGLAIDETKISQTPK